MKKKNIHDKRIVSAEDLIYFLDFVVKSYGIGPDSSIEYIGDPDNMVLELIEELDHTHNQELAQDAILRWLEDIYRNQKPNATQAELLRFMFHCGAQLAVDRKNELDDYDKLIHSQSRQVVSDSEIKKAMADCGLIKAQAAKRLGITVRQLHRRLNAKK